MPPIKVLVVLGLVLIMMLGCKKDDPPSGIDRDAGGDDTSDGTGGTDDNGGSDSGNDIDNNGGTSTDGNGGTGLGEHDCAPTNAKVEVNPINMLILLDRSNSMRNEKIGEDTYEDIVAEALNNVVGINDELDRINFGLAVFPTTACNKYDTVLGDEIECGGTAEISVDIAPDNKDTIAETLASVGVCGGTPTSASLSWAVTYVENQLPSNVSAYDTYILLATDGEPNCNLEQTYTWQNALASSCETCDPADDTDTLFEYPKCDVDTRCIDDTATYAAAKALADKGFKVFVIGIGGADAYRDTILNETAVQGGTEKYYSAEDPDALNSALQEITGKALSCTFNVDWDAVPDVDENGGEVDKKCNKVKIQGIADTSKPDETQDIPYSYQCANDNGWHWKGLDKEMKGDEIDDTPLEECTTIELCPTACESLKAQTFAEIKTSFGCGGAVF